MQQQVINLFQYLLALRHLNYAPIKDISEQVKSFYIDELLLLPGCELVKDHEQGFHYLEISRQHFLKDCPVAPDLLHRMYEWLEIDYQNETMMLKDFTKAEKAIKFHVQALEMKLESSEVNIQATLFEQIMLSSTASVIDKKLALKQFETFCSFNWLEQHRVYETAWKQWAHVRLQKRKTQEFYNYLFHLMQEIDADSAQLELMLGSGILHYDEQTSITYPILTTKLEISFDALAGVAKLVPTSKGVSLELEILASVTVENSQEILALRQEVKTEVSDLFDASSHADLLTKFIHFMHPEGSYTTEFEPMLVDDAPILSARQVIYVRKTSDMLLKEDLRQSIEYIEKGGKISRTLQAIFDTDALTLTKEDLKEWDKLSESLLFPLHANEEQRDIARRLAHNLAVTVQGPPGTGKSHTIANLISHLLANGKRILITSEKDKALRVLMDKLPQTIAPLCVSYLGGDRASLQQIEESIRYISNGLAEFDEKLLQKEIQNLSHQLEMVRRQMQLTKRNIVRFMELDAKAQPFGDQLYQPYELARLVASEYQQFSWFNDKVEMDAPMPITNEEFVTLWELKAKIPKNHEQILLFQLPDLSVLPQIDEFETLVGTRKKITDSFSKLFSNEKFYTDLKSPTLVPSLIQKVEDIMLQVEQIERYELKTLFKDAIVSQDHYKKIERVYEALDKLLFEINEEDVILVNTKIECPDLLHPKFEQYVMQLRERIHSQRRFLPNLFAFNRELKRFYETTIINGHPIQSQEDIKKLLLFAKRERQISELKQMWATELSDVTTLKYDHVKEYHQMLQQFRFILHTASAIFELNEILNEKMGMTIEITHNNLYELHAVYDRLKGAYYHQELLLFEQEYEKIVSRYDVQLKKGRMHPLGRQLFIAIQNKDTSLYAATFEQLQQLELTKQYYDEFNALMIKLKATTPLFSAFIQTRLERKEVIPGTFEDIFTYGKLNTFLTRLNSCEVEELEEKLTFLELEEKRLISELVHKMTWKELIKKITPEQDRALQMWMQQMVKLGKGTGKQAELLKRESRLQMEKCQSAIPVWIMPVKEALETFKVNPDLFDVVIMDESSQCNIMSLPLLMRAKKAVIVGDEQQISPIVPGIKEAQVQELYKRYMAKNLTLQSFDLETSIYDIAQQVFSSKGKLMLKEHFRSVPEIISFSNDMFYHNEMIPLKLPVTPKEQKQPVVSIYVEHAQRQEKKVNVKEAEAIVAHIVEMCKDPMYDHHTMGVISLLGSEQARYIQRLLVDAIGEQEMIERQLVCGDAYCFQGDERDIMFLSLVIAPNMRYNALSQKMYLQRFNVAASRAKVQMRLYHSITLDELSVDDLRYQLLKYFMQPKSSFYFEAGVSKTKFEQDVVKALESRGYSVYPNVKIGKYEIDLVIQSHHQRLGLSCDGDVFYGVEHIEQELERQRILKRCGWTFSRLRATDFYQNETKALAPIIAKLEKTDALIG